MDGNGRWAQLRGEQRSFGHQAGSEVVHTIAKEAAKIGVRYLTLDTFSIENWSRPSDEIDALMNLLTASLDEQSFIDNNIVFKVIGDITKLPNNVQEGLSRCIKTHLVTQVFNLALSYSSRWEITNAETNCDQSKEGLLDSNEITEDCISNHLTI